MRIVSLFICFMLLFSCINDNKDDVNDRDDIIDVNKNIIRVSKNDTVVIGQALDAKGGAVIVSVDENVYYIDGLNYWNNEIYSKLVKVSGKLLIEEFKKPDLKHGDITPQFMVGKKRTILNPKWELVK